jgi:hypothetical protein
MEPTIIEQINAMKREHAQIIVEKIAELVAVVNSRDDIWGYGLPPSLINIVSMAAMQKKNIEDAFSLTTATPIGPQ